MEREEWSIDVYQNPGVWKILNAEYREGYHR
jgi:hypothetical protein